MNRFSRTALLFGLDNMEVLYAARVAVFGIGGVGGSCCEALVRSGIGGVDLFDDDRVCVSNINRQIIATDRTVGRYKVDVMRERLLDINPVAAIGAYRLFYTPDNADEIDLSAYDYIVDAVDTVTAKLELACRAAEAGVPLISSMGAANKLEASMFEVADIYETSVCPVARVMRRELRKRGISALKVVYSTEEPHKPTPHSPDGESCADCLLCPQDSERCGSGRRQIPASNAFVPPAAGLIIAGEVVKDLLRIHEEKLATKPVATGFVANNGG